MSAAFVLRMFGALRLETCSESLTKFQTKRSALILARLAISKGQHIGRDELAEQLWPDDFLDVTRLRLRQELRRLRQTVGTFGDHLRTDRQWVEIEPGILTSDVEKFDLAILAVSMTSDPVDKVSRLTEAVSLLDGPFLAGFQDPWVLATRREYEDKARRAWLDLADTHQALGDHDEALRATVSAVRNSPLDLDANAALIKRLAERGQAAQARQAFLDFDAVMFRELGRHAPNAVRAIIREASADLDVESATSDQEPRPQVVRPLPLFGRDELLRQVESALSRQGASIVLVGTVGIGKSHLLKEAVWQFSRQTSVGVQMGGIAEPVDDGLYIPDASIDADDLVNQIRQAALGGWRVLAESRVRLESDGITEILVNPLTVPNSADTIEAILLNPSVRLLLANAVDKEGLTSNEKHVANLAELARRLDGIPAALRIFGSRLMVQTPDQVLQAFNDGLSEYASDAQVGPGGVHASIAKTVSQLPEAARDLLISLSLLDGASVNLANKLAEPHDAAELWRSLERRCLITVSDDGLRRRYRIPNPIAFVIRALFATEDRQEMVSRTWHALSQWAFRYSRMMGGADQENAFASVQAELPNLVRAMNWAIEHNHELAGNLVLGTWRTVCARGNPSIEGEVLVKASEVGAPFLSLKFAAETWVGCATLSSIAGRTVEAEALYLRAINLYESDNQTNGIAWATMNYASNVLLEGNPQRAAQMCKEAADMTDDPVVRDLALSTYGLCLADLGEQAEALRVGEQVFASRLQSKDLTEQARAYGELADIYRRAGRPEAALPLLTESAKRLRETGIQDVLFATLMSLIEVTENPQELRQTLDQAHALATRIGSNSMLLQVARAQMKWATENASIEEIIISIEHTFKFTQNSESLRERHRSLRALEDVLSHFGKSEYANAISATLNEPVVGNLKAGWQALLSSDSHATICVLAVVMAKEALSTRL
jgi:DNA-binding SARP family transcriptional activator